MNDTANPFSTAVSDAERLLAHLEMNTAVYAFQEAQNPARDVETHLLSALNNPVPRGLATGVPLLRFLDPEREPQPLIEAVVFGMERPTRTRRCERCGTNAGGQHRLLVPMGGSVVAYHCCRTCRNVLTEHVGELVWD